MRKILFSSAALLVLLAGCATDRTPTLPVEIQTIDVGRQPHSLSRSFVSDHVLVSCFGSGKIMDISLSGQRVSKTYTVGKGPTQLVREPKNQRIYVLHTLESALSILAGKPLRVKRTLRTGSMNLAGAAIRPGTNQLWVCDGVSGVNILVTPRIQLKKKIQLGRYPQNTVFTADGKLALITLKGENTVVMVDAGTGEKVTTIPVGIYPRDIILVGNTACVSNFGSHDVSLLDVGKREERARIPVHKKPNRLAAHKNTLWVSCEKSYRIVAIDVAKAKVIGTVKTGFYPGAIQALKDGSLIVAAPQKHKVAIIRPQPQSQSGKGQ
ncbi:hypothetical protein KAR34_04190 [bacterium]|nr:hypothetical protein [bacterium]